MPLVVHDLAVANDGFGAASPPEIRGQSWVPKRHTVERFIELVEAGRGMADLEGFHTENASMQENQSVPGISKPVSKARLHGAQ